RFRQNLLGKRVDYSGRSVIVVGPTLKLHQCGLPKEMALELFKPFVMKKLVDRALAHNIKSAKRMVERVRPEVWDVLGEVIKEHPVLLNRAPTLHRLGIQAFEPVLVEGKAIHLHPLVCTPYNADFDGDQMAVHLPLSAGAQAEARILMLSSNNILLPAYGNPVSIPTQDMVLGLYYLTLHRDEYTGPAKAAVLDDYGDKFTRAVKEHAPATDAPGAIPTFGDPKEAVMAYETRNAGLQEWVYVRWNGQLIKTTIGRVIFNLAFPERWDHPFVNKIIDKGSLKRTITDCYRKYGNAETARFLDAIKDLGFHFATLSGTTVSINDIIVPEEKYEIVNKAQNEVDELHRLFDQGFISDDEQYNKTIEIWSRASEEVTGAMQAAQNPLNPVFMMATSGARGSIAQVKQLGGMRGLMSDPSGRILEIPVKASLKEGLTVLEYFISTHGARKGLADTALRTADSGYLTRRLVDVAQDVIVREEDCGTDRSIVMKIAEPDTEGRLRALPNIENTGTGRTLAEDVEVDGKVVAEAGLDTTETMIEQFVAANVGAVRTFSVLVCEAKVGVCAKCYGRSLATGKRVDVGEAVGIVAAQSIGEPGTQLTMRTFHTGGVAGQDITHGLPRIQELFEARIPKGMAPISEMDGRVKIEETEKARKIIVVPDDGGEEISYPVPMRSRPLVADGDHVRVGEQLIHGAVNPHEVLRILGSREVQLHLVHEVQEVYRSQGVSIHDKHIEIIIRQMLKRVNVLESGDTELLPGELVERPRFEELNRGVVEESGTPASGRPVLMGITKASLATESWLSAASFQETTRVLTDAAIHAKSDPLLGLKENVIIGKLIPAGTGLPRYRNIRVEPTEEAKAAMYSAVGYDDIDYSPFGTGSGQAVPLEDYDYGPYTG